MPVSDYTSVGTHSFTVPVGVSTVTATCIGGGGAGEYDNFADAFDFTYCGAGGAGGGFAKSTVSVTPGEVYTIFVGSGGSSSSASGQPSYFVKSGTSNYVAFGAGGPGSSPSVGSSGSIGNVAVVEGGRGDFGSNDFTTAGTGGLGGRAGNLTTMSPLFRSSAYRPFDRGGLGCFLDGSQNTGPSSTRAINFGTYIGGANLAYGGTTGITNIYISLQRGIFEPNIPFNFTGTPGYMIYLFFEAPSPFGPITGSTSGTITEAFNESRFDSNGAFIGEFAVIGTDAPYPPGIPEFTAPTFTIIGNLPVNGVGYGGGGAGNRERLPYDIATAPITDDYGFGGQGAVRLEYTYNPPQILSFTANPSTITNSSGIPSRLTSLSWSTLYTTSVTITDNSTGTVIATQSNTTLNNLFGNLNDIDTGLQSQTGVNSPATKNYTITATGFGGTISSTITVTVYNDNTYTLLNYPPFTTTNGRALNNLESNTQYTVVLGNISAVDMPVQFTGSSNLQISNDNNLWTSGTILVSNGNTLYGRFTSLPFNTNTTQTGINSSGLAIGSTNPQTLTFSLPYGSPPQGGIYNFLTQTRAPIIQELFNSEGSIDTYPYPDIDTVPNPNTDLYIGTPVAISLNDIEIPVELKTNDPNVQTSINSSPWTNTRSI